MSTPSGSAGGERRLVIVADPDWDTRTILHRALEHAGYDVLLALDGDTLLAIATRDGADLVIAEIYMRCKGGRCSVQCLKQEELLRHIPVLVYTSRVLPVDEQWAIDIGAERYLRKPARLDALLAVAAETMAMRRTTRPPNQAHRGRPADGGDELPRS